MPVIVLERQHNIPLNELKTKLEKIVSKIETQLSVRTEWESDQSLNFRRKGASGNITIDETQLQLTVRLGMMFRALKAPIEAEIEAAVDSYLE